MIPTQGAYTPTACDRPSSNRCRVLLPFKEISYAEWYLDPIPATVRFFCERRLSVTTSFHFDIRPQPDNTTCGPTCLHAVYRYFEDPIDLSSVIADVPTLDGGGTLAVYLANHALRRGYRTTIIPYNLQIFDPTWSDMPPGDIAGRLRRQRAVKPDLPEIDRVTDAYLEYLQLGGRLRSRC
jgi:hypothetical protein